MKKIQVFISFCLITLLFSCGKGPIILPDTFDPSLVGTWVKTYSTIDNGSMITIWYDTLEFRGDQTGRKALYRFDMPETVFQFRFYTEDGRLYDIPDNHDEFRYMEYRIETDSLYLNGSTHPYFRLP